MMAGLFHDGIPSVGTGGSRRMAPAALFASAPRLHSGLRPGEFPAILEHGERVTSKRDVARERGGRGGLTVNFLTPDIGSFNRNGRQVERSLKRRLGKL
jgi:hypothetical protein